MSKRFSWYIKSDRAKYILRKLSMYKTMQSKFNAAHGLNKNSVYTNLKTITSVCLPDFGKAGVVYKATGKNTKHEMRF